MCTSVAEGGRRCTGQHLTIEQHANRADRRRAADRQRCSAWARDPRTHNAANPPQK